MEKRSLKNKENFAHLIVTLDKLLHHDNAQK